MTTAPTAPLGVTVRPLAMGEVAATRRDGDVILADAGATLLHLSLPGGSLHVVLSPEEAQTLGADLLKHGRSGVRRRRRGE